jgi:hypothetical protein
VSWALPAVWHRLAAPLEVQVGAASASGATAIATALAPAINSGAMKLRIFMMRYSSYWPALLALSGSRVRQAKSSMLPPKGG